MSVYDFHTPAASELTHIVQTQKIPNAFIFAGNPGIGKERAAYNFAQAVNCRVGTQGKPCLSCPSCRKIEAHMHPDMLHIGLPEKKKKYPSPKSGKWNGSSPKGPMRPSGGWC